MMSDGCGYTYPNGVQTSYAYNSEPSYQHPEHPSHGRGMRRRGNSLASYAYNWGAAGNRLSVAELSGRTVNYGYDDLYRLRPSENIAGDPLGNSGVV